MGWALTLSFCLIHVLSKVEPKSPQNIHRDTIPSLSHLYSFAIHSQKIRAVLYQKVNAQNVHTNIGTDIRWLFKTCCTRVKELGLF